MLSRDLKKLLKQNLFPRPQLIDCWCLDTYMQLETVSHTLWRSINWRPCWFSRQCANWIFVSKYGYFLQRGILPVDTLARGMGLLEKSSNTALRHRDNWRKQHYSFTIAIWGKFLTFWTTSTTEKYCVWCPKTNFHTRSMGTNKYLGINVDGTNRSTLVSAKWTKSLLSYLHNGSYFKVR